MTTEDVGVDVMFGTVVVVVGVDVAEGDVGCITFWICVCIFCNIEGFCHNINPPPRTIAPPTSHPNGGSFRLDLATL